MLIPKKTRVAVESLVYIAAKSVHRPIPAREVAQALTVSLAGMESILRVLREQHLVCSFKGPGGGYQIASDLKKFTVFDVARLFEPAPAPSPSDSLGSSGSGVAGDDFASHFHRAYKNAFQSESLDELINAAAASDAASVCASKPRFGLRPLTPQIAPRGPNSVFQLHACEAGFSKSHA